jgi:hypothetical protein
MVGSITCSPFFLEAQGWVRINEYGFALRWRRFELRGNET